MKWKLQNILKLNSSIEVVFSSLRNFHMKMHSHLKKIHHNRNILFCFSSAQYSGNICNEHSAFLETSLNNELLTSF